MKDMVKTYQSKISTFFQLPKVMISFDMFRYQLSLIKIAMIPKTVILGDFNLDYERMYHDNYARKHMLDDIENELSEFNLNHLL